MRRVLFLFLLALPACGSCDDRSGGRGTTAASAEPPPSHLSWDGGGRLLRGAHRDAGADAPHD
jgi:hypothetical protein